MKKIMYDADLRALTVRQPFVELILRGQKKYEIRTKRTKHTGLLFIHSAKAFGHVDIDDFKWLKLDPKLELDKSAILGTVEIQKCVPFSRSILAEMYKDHGASDCKWSADYNSLWAWKLSKPRRLRKPVFCSGQLGIWKLSDVLKKKVIRASKT